MPVLKYLNPADGLYYPVSYGGPPPELLDDLLDADTTTVAPVAGDTLTFDGSNWVPDITRFASIAARDAAITAPVPGMRCTVEGRPYLYTTESGWVWAYGITAAHPGVINTTAGVLYPALPTTAYTPPNSTQLYWDAQGVAFFRPGIYRAIATATVTNPAAAPIEVGLQLYSGATAWGWGQISITGPCTVMLSFPFPGIHLGPSDLSNYMYLQVVSYRGTAEFSSINLEVISSHI